MKHIVVMSERAASVQKKTLGRGAEVLGRSAATGRPVLKPISKVGKVTLKSAKAAISAVEGKSEVVKPVATKARPSKKK